MAGSLMASTEILGATTASGPDNAAVLAFVFIFYAVVLGTSVLMIVSMWKVFEKANRPGWAAIIPIYNTYIMLEMCGRPAWWLILMLFPPVNFVILIILFLDLAKMFGQGVGFGIGLLFLPFIFFPILAFGSARYVGYAGGGFPVMPGYVYPQYGSYPPGTFPSGYVPPSYPAGGYPPPNPGDNPGGYPNTYPPPPRT